MKARVEADALRKAMKRLMPAVPQSSNLPVLTCVRMVVQDDDLFLTTSNLDLTIRTSVTVGNPTEGVVLVPAKPFASIIDKAPAGAIELCLADGKLDISAGDTLASLNTLEEGGWPLLPEAKTDTLLTVDQLAAIAKVLPAASTDEGRPVLCGVHFTGDRIEATDSFRLRVIDIPGAGFPDALIPASALSALLKGFSGDVHAGIGSTNVSFEDDVTSWTVRQIDGGENGYPPIARLIDEGRPACDRHLTFDVAQLVDAIDQVTSIGEVAIRVAPRAGGDVTLWALHDGYGKIEATIPCDGDYDALVAFNPTYLRQAALATEQEKVRIDLAAWPKPAFVVTDTLVQMIQPILLGAA